MKKLEEKPVSAPRQTSSAPYRPCDELAMAATLSPDVILKSDTVSAYVELHGNLCRGQMIVDDRSKNANVTIMKDVNRNIYSAMLYSIYHADP